jgi:hypothetical protein
LWKKSGRIGDSGNANSCAVQAKRDLRVWGDVRDIFHSSLAARPKRVSPHGKESQIEIICDVGQALELGGAPEEKRDFSHPQADPFTGVKEEEKVGLLRSK